MSSITPDIVAIVPAAGIGSRMQSERPKQYLLIDGKTILEHSIRILLMHPRILRVVVALHPEDHYFPQLSLAQEPRISTVTGGKQRCDSVLAALNVISDVEWVLVHDAARPCLRYSDLERLITLTEQTKIGGILVTPVRDTIKRSQIGEPQIAYTVERDNLWHALTPQLFPLELLRDCLQQVLAKDMLVTDEASALEYCGYQPHLVLGHADNIKVTRPEDLALAEFYLSRLQDKERR